MDAPPSHFFDYLDFDDPNAYQSPDQDDDVDAIRLNPFNQYSSKQGVDGPQTLADPRAAIPRADVWDGFTDEVATMSTADQKQLFVDPELYSPDSEKDETKAQIQVIPMGMSQPSTRRTSRTKSPSHRTSKSGSISTDITPPEQEPPKKRKVKRIKKESNTAEEDRRRRKFLERNRIAASKCREKKKQYVSELEETKIGLETHHTHLQLEANALIAEISGLKHRLMAHAKCNDVNIDRWLNNEARKFVQTNNELFGQSFLPFAPGHQAELSTGSPRSRNNSIASTYAALPGVQFEGLGSGERQGSIAFSHGSESLYPSPTDATFPVLSPALKREPDLNYSTIADPMFSPDQSTFGGG